MHLLTSIPIRSVNVCIGKIQPHNSPNYLIGENYDRNKKQLVD